MMYRIPPTNINRHFARPLIALLVACGLLTTAAHAIEAPCGTGRIPRPKPHEFLSPAQRPARPAEFAVGDQETLWIYNFVDKQHEEVAFTYRAVNENSYILVDDKLWSLSDPTKIIPSDVDRLSEVFERNSGRAPGIGVGIYQILTEQLAPVTPVYLDPSRPAKRDSMVFIALTAINGDYGDAYIAGYVSERDRFAAVKSNIRNLIVLDAVNTPRTLREETLAHEFQHVIHMGQDINEARWIDEGIAVYSETLCGYPGNSGRFFFANPAIGLFQSGKQSTLADYDKAYLIIRYLAEHFGDELIRRIVRSPLTGIPGIDVALSGLQHRERFEADIFPAWTVANLSRPRSDTRYAYRVYNPVPHHPTNFGKVGTLPVVLQGNLPPYGLRYIRPSSETSSGAQGTLTTGSTVDWQALSIEPSAYEMTVRPWHRVQSGSYRDCSNETGWVVLWHRAAVNDPEAGYVLDWHEPRDGLQPAIVTRSPSPGATNVSPQTITISAEFANIAPTSEVNVTVRRGSGANLERDIEIIRHSLDGQCGRRITVTDRSFAPLPDGETIVVSVSELVGADGTIIPANEASWSFRTGGSDLIAPVLTVGLLPNPVLPEYVSVIVLSDEPLYPANGSDHITACIDGTTSIALTQRDTQRRRWSGTIRLGEGEYEINVAAADAVGNAAEFSPVTFAVSMDGSGVVSARLVSRVEVSVQ